MSDPSRRPVRGLAAMSRPDQLALIAFVYGLGALVAVRRGATPEPTALAFGAVATLAVSASVHYANEYADVETDSLTERTAFSGGSGAAERYGVGRSLAWRATVATALVGTALTGLGLGVDLLSAEAAAGLALVAVLGWAYSLPPVALSWRGLGELDNALLGGVVLPAVGVAVAADAVSLRTLALFVPFGALVFANLLATGWPDRDADAAVGKLTLPVRWSAPRLRRAYWGAVLASAGTFAGLWLVGWLPTVVAAATLPAYGLAVWAGRGYTRRRSPFPSVAAMVAYAGAHAAGWLVYGLSAAPL